MNDDAALVAALAGGPEAFAPIVERYRDAAFGVALARLRNFHDAEDITQAAFVEAYERLGNLKDPARLGAWLRSITIHRCIDHLRRRVEVAGVEEIDGHLSDPATPHTEMERQELRDRIMAAIGRLSRPVAETTVLFYINSAQFTLTLRTARAMSSMSSLGPRSIRCVSQTASSAQTRSVTGQETFA